MGVFPDRASVYRLTGTILVKTDEDWWATRRYFSQESMQEVLNPEPVEVQTATPLLAESLLKIGTIEACQFTPLDKTLNSKINLARMLEP